MMSRGANSANAARNLGHVFGRSSLGEYFEAAQLWDLQKRTFDIAPLVKEDIDLAVPLKTRDGVNHDVAGHCSLAWLR